ncbi:MAG TPA: DUF192 domain-containing protein [Thermomicrobiales bacterium]|nr:DUF192 domain-containing protein [Thermomicrobiales bacterium]
MPTFLLAVTMVLGMVGGVSMPGASSVARQVAPSLLETAEITVGGVPLTVELAYQPADRALGLSYREGLAPGTGMLFLFEEPAPRSFWMRDMLFCIDIIWIENGVIQGAAESVCPEPAGTADADLRSYVSPVPVTYVLEVPAGWLAAHGLGVGTPVEGLPSLVMR